MKKLNRYEQDLINRMNEDNDIPKKLLKQLLLELGEWGPEVAIYNLGFQMGWNNRDSK